MDEPIELVVLYFNWLCAKVIDTTQTSPGLTYWQTFKMLYTTEFAWLLSGDDNRAADGKDLRRQFLIEGDIPDYPNWRIIPCSVLEMLVAFSRRAAYMTDEPYTKWFWIMMDNLGLREFNDGNFDPYSVDEIVSRFVWRQYDWDGNGSLFPIRNSDYDQRVTEVWTQLCSYLISIDA